MFLSGGNAAFLHENWSRTTCRATAFFKLKRSNLKTFAINQLTLLQVELVGALKQTFFWRSGENSAMQFTCSTFCRLDSDIARRLSIVQGIWSAKIGPTLFSAIICAYNPLIDLIGGIEQSIRNSIDVIVYHFADTNWSLVSKAGQQRRPTVFVSFGNFLC